MKALYGGLIQRSPTTHSTLKTTQAKTAKNAKRAIRPSHDLLRATRYLSMRRTLFMVTASTGTSSKPFFRPVATAAILSMTSMPCVTSANTA